MASFLRFLSKGSVAMTSKLIQQGLSGFELFFVVLVKFYVIEGIR